MPSRLKRLMVSEATDRYRDVGSMVAVSFSEIAAEDATELRRSLREREVDIRVVRNRTTRLALGELGRGSFAGLLHGQTAIVAADDAVAASKAAVEVAKERKLDVRGGWAEGRDISEEEVRYLSALPSREALLARIAGLAAAPLRGVVGMIAAPGASLARALRAWNEKRGESGGEEAAGPAQ